MFGITTITRIGLDAVAAWVVMPALFVGICVAFYLCIGRNVLQIYVLLRDCERHRIMPEWAALRGRRLERAPSLHTDLRWHWGHAARSTAAPGGCGPRGLLLKYMLASRRDSGRLG